MLWPSFISTEIIIAFHEDCDMLYWHVGEYTEVELSNWSLANQTAPSTRLPRTCPGSLDLGLQSTLGELVHCARNLTC